MATDLFFLWEGWLVCCLFDLTVSIGFLLLYSPTISGGEMSGFLLFYFSINLISCSKYYCFVSTHHKSMFVLSCVKLP